MSLMAVNAIADDYTTAGDGTAYTLASLSEIAGSGVTKADKVYTLANNVTIATGDSFTVESGATVKLATDVTLRIEGTANFAAEDRVTVTRADESAEPKGIFVACDTEVTTFKNIDFSYAGLRNFGDKGLTVENCTFRYANGKLTSAALGLGSADACFEIKNCTFEENSVPAIAGAANYRNGVTIDNCKFVDNNTKNGNNPQVSLPIGGNNSIIVENCTVTGTQRTNVGGIAVSNMMSTSEGDNIVYLANNTITGNRYGIALYGGQNATLSGNNISDNKYATNAYYGGSGVSLYSWYSAPNVTMTGNTIEENLWGITVLGGGILNFGKTDTETVEGFEANEGHNIFKNNGNQDYDETCTMRTEKGDFVPFDLCNNSTAKIYAQGNRWSVDEQTAEKIETVIFHKTDKSTLGEVIYTPAWTDGSVKTLNAATAVRYADSRVIADGEARVEVYTPSGALVAVYNAADGVADLSQLARGLYLARVTTAGGTVTLKCLR